MKIVKTAAAVSMMIDTESFLKLVGWMSFSVDTDIYVAIYGVSDDSHETTQTQKPHFSRQSSSTSTAHQQIRTLTLQQVQALTHQQV